MSKHRALIAFFLLFLICSANQLSAQYADMGNGALRNYIWWLDWSGLTIANGGTRTFTLPDGLTLNVTISNVSTYAPVPGPMNANFSASPLSKLYDFTNTSMKPSLMDAGSGFSGFTFNITATRNGSPADVTLIAADGEASWGRSSPGQTELNGFTTSGSPWQTISFEQIPGATISPTSTVEGCGTNAAIITNTYNGSPYGQSPLIATFNSSSSGPLKLDIKMDHTTSSGVMAVTCGILLPYAQGGTIPPSFGSAWHLQKYTVPKPCEDPARANELTQDQSLKLGLKPGNPDNPPGAEDGITLSGFPPYDGSGSYSVTVKVGNTTGSDAYLSAYFDNNRDGTFGSSEATPATIVHNADGTATVTWTGLPKVLPGGVLSSYAFRFRLSSDKTAIASPTGYSPDGEVEDYQIPAATLCGPLSASVTPDFTLCNGKSSTLQASGGKYYSWTPTIGLSDPAIANPIVTTTTTTTYTVKVYNPQGCSLNTMVNVTAQPLPTVQAGTDQSVCRGKTITLLASGAATYTWTSSTDPGFTATGSQLTVIPNQDTRYSVTGATAENCGNTATVNVTVLTPATMTATAASYEICQDDTAELTGTGADHYTWTDQNGDALGSTPVIRVYPETSTQYTVLLTDDACQLQSTKNLTITVKNRPDISLIKSNDISCSLSEVTLHARGAPDWVWNNQDNDIAGSFSSDPIVRPTKTKYFYVKGTSGNGCSAIDSIKVVVDYTDLSQYPVPSAFSPNGDGKNDCFRLKYWGTFRSLELEIFDRHGQRVFSTTNPEECWNGTYQGHAEPAGTYIYQIKATTQCGIAYRKGSVVLVR